MISTILVFIGGLCWGSFLNVLAYRTIQGYQWIKGRSFCPTCRTTLRWYELIPLISWLFLQGSCRSCKAPISWLYPALELLTGISFALLWLIFPVRYFFTYAIFFSALIVTIRTDIEHFLVLRAATWGIIPFALAASIAGLAPLSFLESIAGALFGYSILWLVRQLFWVLTKKEGMGLGDLDLLAAIGAFTGIKGAWLSLVIGSLAGLLGAFIHLIFSKKGLSREMKIPFGPFLALGALLYVFLGPILQNIFLGL